MQKKYTFLFLMLMIMSVLILLTNSCRKDDNKGQTEDITVADIDGNVYHTIKIGTQVWTVENLRATRYNDSTAIPILTYGKAYAGLFTEGVCTYNHTSNSDTIETYGRLYNWYAVKNDKLCPKGWHVPSDNEWTTMIDYLVSHGYSYDGSSGANTAPGGSSANRVAKALASSTGWTSSAIEGAVGNTDYADKQNATGFTALPGGSRNDSGIFVLMGAAGFWWSSTENSTNITSAFGRSLINSDYNINQGTASKTCYLSVRCVQDN